MHPFRYRLAVALAAALVLVAGACSDGGGGEVDAGDGGAATAGGFVAQVASYDLRAGVPQRFLAALVGSGDGRVVSFGQVNLEFFKFRQGQAQGDAERRGAATATFLPIAGQTISSPGGEPRAVKPSEGLGVYEASDVTFDEPGFWGVRVKATVDGKPVEADAAFEVVAESRVPAPGSAAPRTANPTGDPSAIDSRARKGEPIPDPELHEVSVADALAAGRPVVVVVSTPVYCVSRFCGPITDTVSGLAKRYRDRAAFVHIEVWADYEAKKLNDAAKEWAMTSKGDLQEPWVFFVGGDGTVKERFDNVASDAQLEAATERLVASA